MRWDIDSTMFGRGVGISAEMMRDELGHKSVNVTLDVYSHASDEQGAAIENGIATPSCNPGFHAGDVNIQPRKLRRISSFGSDFHCENHVPFSKEKPANGKVHCSVQTERCLLSRRLRQF